jgi:hypothetical protein
MYKSADTEIYATDDELNKMLRVHIPEKIGLYKIIVIEQASQQGNYQHQR